MNKLPDHMDWDDALLMERYGADYIEGWNNCVSMFRAALSHAAGQEVVGALSRGVPEGNQDVAAARRERDEAIEEKEYAELELAYLANEMVYEGNSIGWIASKAKKYGDALHRAWTALTEAGGKCDGQTELAEAIRQHFAAIAAQRKEGEK